MLFIQLLLILPNFINSMHAHLPNCQPPAPSSSTHQETLMIFVLDQAVGTDTKVNHWYFLKQLACSVPNSPSIRSFVVDCSANNTNFGINKDTVFDSSQLSVKLFVGFEKGDDSTDRCLHLKNTINALLAIPFVTQHPNHHFIVPVLYSSCAVPLVGDHSFILINFLDSGRGMNQFLTIGGYGDIDTAKKFAPKHLVKTTDSLVNYMVHFNDEEVVDQCPIPDCAEKDNCKTKWLIGIGSVIVAFVYLAIVVIWVRN